ncbi:formimidoylglutamate deiminase [Sphingomonas sp. CL5.1]|uniref:formimidoylglutamate deiminase n=1 Tax=Sphingomonas sp. CL5.1 TaxID=2653203 RepID=UPI002673B815|nr:formimidoylglutamate deiminase [Sphingomonas sp. CL5.1]
MTVLHFAEAMLPEGWARDVRVTVADGVIASVEIGAAAHGGDERHAVALPGMPNLHSHAFQRGMAGLAEVAGPGDDSFWTWREVMYLFAARVSPDDLAAIAAMAYAGMLETGFTRVGEFHYLHHAPDGAPYADRAAMSAAIVAAAEETGIALTHLPVFYAHGGFGGAPLGERQARFRHDLDGFARLLEGARAACATLPDAVVGVAPHSLRAVTPEELAALELMAPGAPIHIHIAEQVREVEDCRAWSGARPMEWLLDHAAVDARWCLVHATHMTADETERLARSGAVAGLCPITEANLGDGIFPAVDFLAAGGRYGVGSDSNVLIDAAEELRLLEYGQRLERRGRNLLGRGGSTGDALWRGAVAGGARALGAASGIAAGNAADIVSLDRDHPAFVAREGAALADAFVFARGAVDCVWRRGAKVVSGGRHVARDAIARRYAATLRRLLA